LDQPQQSAGPNPADAGPTLPARRYSQGRNYNFEAGAQPAIDLIRREPAACLFCLLIILAPDWGKEEK